MITRLSKCRSRYVRLSGMKRRRSHLAQHGVTIWEVEQVLSNPHVVGKNRTRRRAQHLLIGRTHGGRVLTIALAAAKTREASAWRPVTAFLSTQA